MRAAASIAVRTTLLLLLALALIPAASAAAGGQPVIGGYTGQGVVSADGAYKYTAERDGDRTAVRRTSEEGGWKQVRIEGNYVVPGVAIDNTTSGLSHDDGTLVLSEPRTRFLQKTTDLIVLDAPTLAVREEITLDGNYSFDALSPDGETMYLTEYPNPRDATNYRIRAYDLTTGVMAPGPIVDKSEPDEEMAGFPMTRVTGNGGRWEYTLYDGSGHEPFVHALDTVRAETLCIDLPWVSARDVYRADLELVSDGATIRVDVSSLNGDHGPVALIDTATGEAEPIGPQEPSVKAHGDVPGHERATTATPAGGDDDSDEAGIGSGGLIALAVLAVVLIAGLVRVAVYSRGPTKSP